MELKHIEDGSFAPISYLSMVRVANIGKNIDNK
jgi:hypothetical protein